MGKKGKQTAQKMQPGEAEKELGNRAFQAKDYSLAIAHYTKAIEESKDKPNCTFFANRANAFLEIGGNQECISDCIEALKIDKKHLKSYYRQAVAQFNTGQLSASKASIADGLKLDDKNELILEISQKVNKEIEGDEATPEAQRQVCEKFFEWAKNLGFLQQSTKLRFFSEQNRGIVAGCNLLENTPLFELPIKMTMSQTDVQDMPLNKIIAEKYHQQLSEIIGGQDKCYSLNTVEHYYLLNFLLSQLRSPSPDWKPYLDILPTNLSSFPYYFGQEEKQILKGTWFVKQLDKSSKKALLYHNFLLENVPDLYQYTADEFMKALIIIQTRAFEYQIPGKYLGTHGIRLMPYFDMLNHGAAANTQWVQVEGQINLSTLGPVLTGEELFVQNNYSDKDYDEYHISLIKHGYLDDFEKVTFDINIRMAEHHPLFGIKSFMITDEKREDQFSRSAKIGRKYDVQTENLISWLRFLLYDGEEAELHVRSKQVQPGQQFDPRFFKPTTLKREEKVWNQIILIASDFFLGDNQPLSDLEAISKNPDSSESIRTCSKIRLLERQSIQFLLEMANKLLVILPLSFKEAKKTVNTDQSYNLYEKYLEVVWFMMKLEGK